jgi:hypothetical protein
MPLNIEGTGRIGGLTDPAADSDAARKKFVEDKVAEVEISGDLGGLDDVDTFGVQDGDVLTYFDGEDGGWAPGQIDPPPSTTDELTEGTNNLYYTDARADARVSAGVSEVNKYFQVTVDGSESASSDWTGGGPYIATLSIPGILSTDRPFVDLDLSSIAFADVAYVEFDWAVVYRIEASADDEIKLYAKSEPGTQFSLNIKVAR